MIAFSALSPLTRVLLCNASFVTILTYSLLLIHERITRRGRLITAVGTLLLLLSYLLFQFQLQLIYIKTGAQPPDRFSRWFSVRSAAGVILLQLILLLFGAVTLSRSILWRNRHVTLMSVKEGIDRLDTGLCFYWQDGVVKLANKKMIELSRLLTGAPLYYGDKLWKEVCETPIRILPDGTVWSFSRSELMLEGMPIYELTATDITEEYRLTAELREKEAQLKAYNQRLIRYSDEVGVVTVQEETLNTKMRIHDELGETLLTSRRYLESSEDTEAGQDAAARAAERERIAALWEDAIRMGAQAGSPASSNALREILDAGAAIGIEVEVIGSLPEDLSAVSILTAGARTCLTNAYRHAKASKLTICIRAEERDGLKRYEITYRNNGLVPDAPIAEGGGLSSLRQAVEQRGGRMSVEWSPAFELTITLG